jgi:hypothetical protein
VTLTAGVEPYISALPAPGEDLAGSGKEVGWIHSRASGRYLGHTLEHEIGVRHLPQEWPRLFERDVRRGSRNNVREIKLGTLDGAFVLEHRRDHHCEGCKNREHYVEGSMPWSRPHHCDDCRRAEHRVWKPARTRPIPAATVDVLSAVFLARTFVRTGEARSEFPLVSKDDLWTVTLTRGDSAVQETPAGRFTCVRVGVASSVPAGEKDRDPEDFEGLFGLHGDLRIWVHDPTGIPVVIEGQAPVGPFDLQVRARLTSSSGTDPSFAPL